MSLLMYSQQFSEQKFTSFDEILKFIGVANENHYSGFCEIQGQQFYVKLRTLKLSNQISLSLRGAGPFQTPEKVKEYLNLLTLRRLGIPVANVALTAAEKKLGFVTRELLITNKIPGASDMYSIANSMGRNALSTRLMFQLGTQVGRMHNSGFRHRDLFLRNILINKVENVYFIDCRKGRFYYSPFRDFQYDLACFELFAATLLDKNQRESFFAGYFYSRPKNQIEYLLKSIERVRIALARKYLNKRPIHRRAQLPPMTAQTLSSANILSMIHEQGSGQRV